MGMTISGLDSTIKMLDEIGSKMGDVAKKAVRAGADILADDIRRRLEANLAGSQYSTGALLDSFGITPPRQNDDGSIDAKIGFHGYDREDKPTPKYPRGVPNAIKARAMESGTPIQRKKPFMRPAVNASRKKVKETMESVVHTNLDIIKKGGK